MSSEHDKAILNCIFNPLLPIGECIYDENLPNELQDIEDESTVGKETKALELEGVEAAESGDIDKAIGLFTRAISAAPLRPSCFNNRAQAFRLKGNTQAALADLDMAVKLGGERGGRSGCQALCQRGIIHRGTGRDEEARKDFTRAAQLGSEFAREQLVALNPYAALCNQMLHDVMAKLRDGEQ